MAAIHMTSTSLKPNRTPLLPSKILGMSIFVFTEVMFFTALISAFLVIKGDQGSLEIPFQIRLPIMSTAYNTLILLVSGILLFVAGRENISFASRKRFLGWSAALGFMFVTLQGYEWLQLISFGLTMTSSIFGALFFLLIGCHGLHVLCGALALIYFFYRSPKSIDLEGLRALQIFWFFVVGVWPILYWLVYF